MEKELRQKAKELLESGQVKFVIGFEAGTVPFKSSPLFAENAEEADRLVWNPTCVNNLSVYLPDAAKKGKVAVVLKPCDAKNVVELFRENQISKDSVVTIVVSLPGIMKMEALDGIDLKTIQSIDWDKDGIVVKTTAGDVKIPAEKAFANKCQICEIGEPALADIKIGDFGPRIARVSAMASVEAYEKMSPTERRDFWTAQFSKCIRCYACRQACPGCYCKECFVDKNGQVWASKATDPTANWFFHMTRMMHQAGRCTGCGECARACPVGIPLALMSLKMTDLVKNMFEFTPGAEGEEAPMLGHYEAKDPDPCPE
jgi:coenzyme F420-reducing hydrogenase beta subunit